MLTEHVKIHLGWSQNELARRMGISPQKLSYQIRNETFELERINRVLVEHGAPEYDPRWETDRTERMTKLDLVNENNELRQKLTQCEARVDKLLEIIINK
jgi:transcriptional regulator with XRE-family HTH domain